MLNKLFWLFRKAMVIDFSYKLSRTLRFASIFFYILTFYYVGHLVDKAAIPSLEKYGGEYFSFVLFGLAVNSYFNTARNTFNSNLRNEQVLGTLEPVVATGTGVPVMLMGLSVYDFANLTVQMGAMVSFGVVFFGVSVFWSNILPALFILVLSILAFIGFGMLSASFTMVFKRGDPLGWMIGNISTVMSGVFYPVEILPVWIQKLASLLPLTHSLKAIRLVLLKGATLYEVRQEVFILGLFAFILLPASIFCLRYALKKATIEGTLAGH